MIFDGSGKFDLGSHGTTPSNSGTSVLLTSMGENLSTQFDDQGNGNFARQATNAGATVVTSFQLNEALAQADSTLPPWPKSNAYYESPEVTGNKVDDGELEVDGFGIKGKKKPIEVTTTHLGVASKAESVIPRGRDKTMAKKPGVPSRVVETKDDKVKRLKSGSKERKDKAKVKKSKSKSKSKGDATSAEAAAAASAMIPEDDGLLLASLLNKGTSLARDIDSAIAGNLPQNPTANSDTNKDNSFTNSFNEAFESEGVMDLLEEGDHYNSDPENPHR